MRTRPARAGLPPEASTGGGTRWRRRFLPIWATGVVGVAALLLVTPPPAALQGLPQAFAWPPLAVRALLALNPLLLVTLFAAVGASCAHLAGVTSLLAGTQPFDQAAVVASLSRAVALGLAAGLAFAWVDGGLLPRLDPPGAAALQAGAAGAPGPVVGALYGGLAEEVIARWGVMSAAAFAIAAAAARLRAPPTPRVTRGIAVAAVVAAAAAFAAAHLPALVASVDVSPGVLWRTLGLNLVAGLLCGALAFRRGLEAAMAAHAAMHLGMAAGAALLV